MALRLIMFSVLAALPALAQAGEYCVACNGPGATSVCVYSTRARPGAAVALPLAWEALERELKPGAFNVKNLEQHLAQRERDPWADFAAARAPLRPPASHPRASG